jgi:6-phosphogluconolactonase
MTAVEVLPDAEALARAAAERFVTRAGEAMAVGARFTVALAGGSTPRAAYHLLATEPFSRRVDWGRVHFLWGDERCVPPDDPQSNYRMTRESLLDHVPVPPGNIHRIHGEDDPHAAAGDYERVLRSLLGPEGSIDLILLGMGEDGHTASLFPGGEAVRERVRWVVAARSATGMWRVTLTPAVLNAAREVCFLVSGAAKAERLQAVLRGPSTPESQPAQIVDPARGRLTWLVDAAAAARLG